MLLHIDSSTNGEGLKTSATAVLTLGRRKLSVFIAFAALSLVAGNGASLPQPPEKTIAARAFVITDPETLAPFAFDRVIAALSLDQPGGWLEVIATRDDTLQRRQTIMPMKGFVAITDDEYWWLAGADDWSEVRPIAIVNRFDLAPADYSHCGEYRLVFSRRTHRRERLHIAIETVLPNPHPQQGKAGCASIAAFWWELSDMTSTDARRGRLEEFFFRGLPSVPPALDRNSFEKSGRIRTSRISTGRPKFAQFEVKHPCALTQLCVSRLARVPLDNMPDSKLFDADVKDERGAAFRREFIRQIPSLAIRDVNRYFMNVGQTYSAENNESILPGFNYRLPFRSSQRTVDGRRFREQIAERLRQTGSTLTPEEVVGRAETQNCVGCHNKSGPVGEGVFFPSAFENGEHISDEPTARKTRMSAALENVFLPHRIALLKDFIRISSGPKEGSK